MSTAGFLRLTISASHEEAEAVEQAARIIADEWPMPARIDFAVDSQGVTATLLLPRAARVS